MQVDSKFILTSVGALTSKVTTRTTVPPSVHHTLNALIRPMAFVPIVLRTPEKILTAHATAAISTLVSCLPDPISAQDAR